RARGPAGAAAGPGLVPAADRVAAAVGAVRALGDRADAAHPPCGPPRTEHRRPSPAAGTAHRGPGREGRDRIRGGGGRTGAERRRGGQEERRWVIPEIGWDDASFDGLRTLQSAAGLRPAPPRPALVAEARRRRRAELHREYARRLGMPWKEEYARDEEAFQAEFDRIRRVLGGKEPARPGDPRP